jgi:ubiE/COQ5 methyltransferase family
MTWESAAAGWAKWEGVFSAGLSGVTDTLIDMAAIQPGMRILDVARGAGSQSIQAAKRVGPTGGVVASDISATMLEHVRQTPFERVCRTLKPLNALRRICPRRKACSDASVSRLGLMLFPSPRGAFDAVKA